LNLNGNCNSTPKAPIEMAALIVSHLDHTSKNCFIGNYRNQGRSINVRRPSLKVLIALLKKPLTETDYHECPSAFQVLSIKDL